MPKKISTKRALARRERLLRELPELGAVLRGSLVTRFRRCGKPGCHCADEGDPGHGPAYYLVTTIGPGKTVQIYVPKDQKDQVEQFLQNFRLAKQGLEEISSSIGSCYDKARCSKEVDMQARAVDQRRATKPLRRDPSSREPPLERRSLEKKLEEILCEMLLQAAVDRDERSAR